MKNIAIIDYGSGNLRSVLKSFEFCTDEKVFITSKKEDLNDATHIVLPGVGAFGDCINGLKNIAGMIEALNENVIEKKKPFLGICVGMQLLANKGYENGTHEGLGWIEGEVIKINTNKKIPHMGWNNLLLRKKHDLLKGLDDNDHAYFVHSYYFNCKNKENILSEVEYDGFMPAIIAKDNIFATQFHPEKSQKSGLQLIRNFVNI